MPAKSKAQFRFMRLVASGKKRVKGLSKEKAKEWLRGVNYKSLPNRVKSSKKRKYGRKKRAKR